MFRIECFCDDNKLAKVLWLLRGHVYNLTNEPIINAKKASNGQVKPRVASGELENLFIAYAKQHKLRSVKAAEMRAFMNHLGFAEGSYSFYLTKLKNAKLLTMAPGSKPPFDVSYNVKLGSVKQKAKPKAKAKAKTKTKTTNTKQAQAGATS